MKPYPQSSSKHQNSKSLMGNGQNVKTLKKKKIINNLQTHITKMVTPKDQIPILSLIYKPKKPSLPLSILGEMDEMGSNGGKSEKMGGNRVRERVLE